MRSQEPQDLPRRALLQLPESALALCRRFCRRRRPAQQGVGVKVAKERGGNGGADGGGTAGGGGGGVLGVVGGDVERPADEGGKGDQVLARRLLRRGDEVPF